MVHAALNTAEEATGKLVTLVRNHAADIATKKQKELIIIDGPPGIGCPVIASITGVDLVVIITEPTLSAIHDLERILKVSQHFDIPAVVCINKCDINLKNTRKIEKYCKTNKIQLVGKLPYNTIVTTAMIQEKTIIEFLDGDFSDQIKKIWTTILERLQQ
jgi:MinD superfamily P-loop ATPase